MSYLKVNFVGAWDGDKSQGYVNTDQIFIMTQKKGYTLIETSSGRACRVVETVADLIGTIKNTEQKQTDDTNRSETNIAAEPIKKQRKPRGSVKKDL